MDEPREKFQFPCNLIQTDEQPPQTDEQPPQTDEEPPKIIGPDGEPLPAMRLVLGIEKFKQPEKHYRLIWIYHDLAWLAEEDTRHFRRHAEAVEAGKMLVEKFKPRWFDEVSR